MIPSPDLSPATLILKHSVEGAACVLDIAVGDLGSAPAASLPGASSGEKEAEKRPGAPQVAVGRHSGVELEGKGYTPLHIDMAKCGLRTDIAVSATSPRGVFYYIHMHAIPCSSLFWCISRMMWKRLQST